MTEPTRSCTTCHCETALCRLEPFSGEEKALAVTIHGLTALACANGHRQFLRADFALELLDHLVEKDEAGLPAGEEKGLLFKHFMCADCGQELQPKPDHRHTFAIEPGIADHPGLRVDLTIAVYRCGGCGKEQLHSLKEVRKLTPAALAHAFKSAGLHGG